MLSSSQRSLGGTPVSTATVDASSAFWEATGTVSSHTYTSSQWSPHHHQPPGVPCLPNSHRGHPGIYCHEGCLICQHPQPQGTTCLLPGWPWGNASCQHISAGSLLAVSSKSSIRAIIHLLPPALQVGHLGIHLC